MTAAVLRSTTVIDLENRFDVYPRPRRESMASFTAVVLVWMRLVTVRVVGSRTPISPVLKLVRYTSPVAGSTLGRVFCGVVIFLMTRLVARSTTATKSSPRLFLVSAFPM